MSSIIDIGKELVEEQALLSSLTETAEKSDHLPVCCLGMVRHPGNPPEAPEVEPDMVFLLEPDCLHGNGYHGSQRWVQLGIHEIPARKAGVISVHLGEIFCGTVGMRHPNGSCHAPDGAMQKFLDHFKSRYLRYYLYHHSRLWMAKESPVIMLGEDPSLLRAQLAIGKYAGSFLPVLIQGETGTGKELWARSLHLWSDRYDKPFLPVNCSQLVDDQMAISSLFGHRRGSYTGAIGDRKGYFGQAAGGTLFLDEIDSLSPRVQGMLLRAMETGEVHKLGADFPETVNVRLIAATNANLDRQVSRERMRKDFLYRIRGHTIYLPPLRDRDPADIITLARFYLQQLNRRFTAGKYFSVPARDLLTGLSWFGNVRELRNAVMTAYFNTESTECIRPEHFPAHADPSLPSLPSFGDPGIEERLYFTIVKEKKDFWEVVYTPFMNRDLNREQVKGVIRLGLREADSYKELMDIFNIPGSQYHKFMDFLRNHDLRV